MRNQSGFTIVEAIIAIAILSFVGLGFAQLMDYVNANMKNASRKLETLELRSAVSSVLSNQSVCSCMMGMFADPVDSTNLEKETDLSEIRSACTTTSHLIVKSNTPVPGSHAELEITKLSLANIQSLGVANQYRAKLLIRFKDNKRYVSLRPIELEGRFSTFASDPDDKKKIEYCNFTGNAFAPPLTNTNAQVCPSGQFVTAINDGTVSCGSPSSSSGSGTSSSTTTTTVAELDPASVTAWNPYGNQNPFSPSNPGGGCTGQKCVTYDFGPCVGQFCKTNGMNCTGQGCCAGPQCF